MVYMLHGMMSEKPRGDVELWSNVMGDMIGDVGHMTGQVLGIGHVMEKVGAICNKTSISSNSLP